MEVEPVETPYTLPDPSIDAILASAVLQLPPDTVDASNVVDPLQTVAEPDMVPADGSGLMVTIVVASSNAHPEIE